MPITRSQRFRRLAAALLTAGVATFTMTGAAGAATPDGSSVGCQRPDIGDWAIATFSGSATAKSRLWVTMPTTTGLGTTYVRYHTYVIGASRPSAVSGWYRSTTSGVQASIYGPVYASGTREWYNQSGQKIYGMSDTLAWANSGTNTAVYQEKTVLLNGRFTPYTWTFAGHGLC